MFEEDISGLFVNDIDTDSDDFELSEEETDALEAAYDDLDEEFDEAINEVEEHCCHYHDDHHHHHHCDHHHCDHHHHHDDHHHHDEDYDEHHHHHDHDHEYDDEHDHEDYHHHHHCDECGGHYHDHDDEDDCSKHHCDHDHEDGHHEHHHHDGDYHHHYHDHDDEYEDDDDQTSEYGDDDDNEEDGPYYKKALYLLEERHRLLNKINAPNQYNISALHRNEAEERYRRELKEVERALDEINVKRAKQGYDEIDLDSAEESILKKKTKDDEFVIERRPVDPEFNDFLNKAHAKYGNPTKDPEFNKKSREFDSRYKSKAKEDAFGLFEDYDEYEYEDYDEYDEAEEASANYNLKKAMQYNKKSAKNNYIASQKYKEISENPNVDEYDRRSAARKSERHMNMAEHHANNVKFNDFLTKSARIDSKYTNKRLKEIYDEDAANDHRRSREKSARSGKERREAYIQANNNKNCKAKEDAFDFGETGLFTTLFTPAYEAAEEYDDNDLLMDEELDEEIKDEPNDMIIDNDEEYSDSEYDKDEELDEE